MTQTRKSPGLQPLQSPHLARAPPPFPSSSCSRTHFAEAHRAGHAGRSPGSLQGPVALCCTHGWGCRWHRCSARTWDAWSPQTGLISNRSTGRGEAPAWVMQITGVQITGVTSSAPHSQPAQPGPHIRSRPAQSLIRAPLGQ